MFGRKRNNNKKSWFWLLLSLFGVRSFIKKKGLDK